MKRGKSKHPSLNRDQKVELRQSKIWEMNIGKKLQIFHLLRKEKQYFFKKDEYMNHRCYK